MRFHFVLAVLSALAASCTDGPLSRTPEPTIVIPPLVIGNEGEGEGAAGEGEGAVVGEGEGAAGEGEGEGEGEGAVVVGEGEGEGEGPAPCVGDGCGAASPAGTLSSARAWHAAVLLDDGRVAVTGGYASSRLASSELNAGDAFSPAPGLFAPRSAHAAVATAGGVVVIGGAGDDASGAVSLDTAELIGVDSGVRVSLPHLDVKRANCTATRLADGRVLVVGGNDGLTIHSSAAILSADLSQWSSSIDVGAPHTAHAAVLLADGRVLVAGGQKDSSGASSKKVAIFDALDANQFSTVASMHFARQGLAAVALDDGRVLVAGGYSDVDTGVESTAEIYNPASDAWTRTADLPELRAFAIAVLLHDGRVALFGGIGDDVETTPLLYDVAGDSWSTGAPLAHPRYGHTATVLPDGSVLVVGGTDGALSPQAVAERWTP